MGRKKLKVGMSLWRVLYDYDDPEQDIKAYTELQEWVIRSIKRSNTKRKSWEPKEDKPIMVYAVHKHSGTWGKRPGKFSGWIEYNINEWNRKSFKLEDYEKDGLPDDLSFTKAGAYKAAIAREKVWIKRRKEWRDVDPEDDETSKKVLKMLTTQYNRHKKKVK